MRYLNWIIKMLHWHALNLILINHKGQLNRLGGSCFTKRQSLVRIFKTSTSSPSSFPPLPFSQFSPFCLQLVSQIHASLPSTTNAPHHHLPVFTSPCSTYHQPPPLRVHSMRHHGNCGLHTWSPLFCFPQQFLGSPIAQLLDLHS